MVGLLVRQILRTVIFQVVMTVVMRLVGLVLRRLSLSGRFATRPYVSATALVPSGR